VTSEGHPYAVLQRSLKNGNLWVAEAVARDMPIVPLERLRGVVKRRNPFASRPPCLGLGSGGGGRSEDERERQEDSR